MSYARINLLPSGQVIVVEKGETILDAALRAGLNLPHSCKGGHCSSCRARIRDGEIHYPLGQPPGLLEQERQEGYALLCQAHPASMELTIEVRDIRPPEPEVEVKSLSCRIERLQRLAPDVMAVFLRLPTHEPFHFVAGQYLDIMLPQSRRRSFSIASAPLDGPQIELHVRRVSKGEFTQQLFAGNMERALLRIEGPLGQFWFRRESARPALMIGGGTGYAPLRSMLRQLLALGDRRPLHLYWGAQFRQDLYEDAQIRKLCLQHPNLTYTPVLSETAADDPGIDSASVDGLGVESPGGDSPGIEDPCLDDHWEGRRGWVHEAALEDHADLEGLDVYASGPPAMVEAVRSEFLARGLPREQLYFDSFDYAPDALAKRGAAS